MSDIVGMPTMVSFERHRLEAITKSQKIEQLKITCIDDKEIETTFRVSEKGHINSIVNFIQDLLK